MAYSEIDGWKAKEDEGLGFLPDGATQLTFEGCTVPEHHAYWYDDRVHAILITPCISHTSRLAASPVFVTSLPKENISSLMYSVGIREYKEIRGLVRITCL